MPPGTTVPPAEPLWREVLGARLRRLRRHQSLTLTELAQKAGLSPQYLSEIERGRKEPSSEMIAAITGALGITLIELTTQVADEMQRDTLSFIGFAPSRHDGAQNGRPASFSLASGSGAPHSAAVQLAAA